MLKSQLLASRSASGGAVWPALQWRSTVANTDIGPRAAVAQVEAGHIQLAILSLDVAVTFFYVLAYVIQFRYDVIPGGMSPGKAVGLMGPSR